MTFQPPPTIPGLSNESDRAVTFAMGRIGQDLDQLRAAGLKLTTIQTTDYTALPGQVVRTRPPAAGLKVLLPAVAAPNGVPFVWISVEDVSSGGVVKVAVTGGTQKVNGASTLSLSSVGLTALVGIPGVGWLATGSGSGGGGLTPPVALSDLANGAADSVVGNITGAPAAHVDVPLSSLAGTGLTYNSGTHKFDVSGGSGFTLAQIRRFLLFRIGP